MGSGLTPDHRLSMVASRGGEAPTGSGGEMAVTSAGEEVLGTFHGSEEFPIDWEEGERELFWI